MQSVQLYKTFNETVGLCNNTVGSTTLSIRSAEENSEIAGKFLTKAKQSTGLFPPYTVWIGLTRQTTWTWNNGETSPFRNWDSNEPSQYLDCAVLRSDGFWASTTCTNLWSFVCQLYLDESSGSYRSTQATPEPDFSASHSLFSWLFIAYFTHSIV